MESSPDTLFSLLMQMSNSLYGLQRMVPKKRKYTVSGSLVGENASVMLAENSQTA